MQEFANHILISLEGNSLYVYIFIFAVAFSESFAFVGLVVPGAAIVVTAGFLASKGYFNIYWIIIFAVSGAILADIASFFIGERYFRYISKTKIYTKHKNYFQKGEEFFKKHGAKSVFLGRFVGFLRPVIPFVAGTLKMNRAIFLFWAVISGILWGIAYIGVGYLSNEGIKLLNRWSYNINYLAIIAVFILVVLYFINKKG